MTLLTLPETAAMLRVSLSQLRSLHRESGFPVIYSRLSDRELRRRWRRALKESGVGRETERGEIGSGSPELAANGQQTSAASQVSLRVDERP